MPTAGRLGFDYGCLLAALPATGTSPSPSLVLLAYSAAGITGLFPLTPGGLGVVEASLSGLLILAGVHPGDAFLATLAYRIASYWLPLLAGHPDQHDRLVVDAQRRERVVDHPGDAHRRVLQGRHTRREQVGHPGRVGLVQGDDRLGTSVEVRRLRVEPAGHREGIALGQYVDIAREALRQGISA